MVTVNYSTIPELNSIRSCVYNDDLTRMIACTTKSRVQILHRSDNQQLWQAITDLPVNTKSAVTQVAWAHSEHGSVVACGSEDGLVTIWQQTQITRGQDERWLQRATLTDSCKPITRLAFAPVQLGPQLAVASGDGYASSSGGCKSLVWRPHTHGLPPMLCVGTDEAATVWYHRKALGDWVQAAVLDTGNQAVSSLDWALGRPIELIAAASSTGVQIWSLKGKAHELQTRHMECLSVNGDTVLDCLPIDGHARKVQFDKMGGLLATSAVDGDGSSVCVWELNPDGQWYLIRRIVGEPAEASERAMLE